MKEYNFETILDCVNRCYSIEVQDRLPKLDDFPIILFDPSKNIIIPSLLEFAKSKNDKYLLSVAKRIYAIKNIQLSRDENVDLNLKLVWQLISESILDIPSESTISSMGSQGFLSIPLFKFDKVIEDFEFIRLHIWDNSLLEYINSDKCKLFSVHSHSFFTQSWIINGRIENESYSVKKKNKKTKSSLFKIEYNKSLNEINQHTSMAINTGQYIDEKKISSDQYASGETYKIDAGEYHKAFSSKENDISSTFFSFTAKNGNFVQSHVTGPSSIQISEINRKMHIDPQKLLESINSKMKA